MSLNALLSEQIAVNVFDPEKKEKIATYDSIAKASRALGVSEKVVNRMCGSRNRAYSPVLKKEVACRVAKKESTIPS